MGRFLTLDMPFLTTKNGISNYTRKALPPSEKNLDTVIFEIAIIDFSLYVP